MDRHRPPHQFEKRILLVTAGMSPAVISETVWVLATQRDPAFIPTEIHCLTTAFGKSQIQQTLLNNNVIGTLWREYDVPGTPPIPQLHVIKQADENLDDIKTEKDNAALADHTTDLIRRFTADPDLSLHVSIAGGRKTMTFLGGYILSLFARDQDRLSHVLVNPQFEMQGFFYPPKEPELITLQDGRKVSTKEARVSLADIPFVRLRSFLLTNPVGGQLSYSEAVTAAQKLVDPPHMLVDVSARCLICQGVEVAFETAEREFAMTAYLAERILEEGEKLAGAITYKEFCDPREQADYAAMLLRVARDDFSAEEHAAKLAKQDKPMAEGTFNSVISRINDRLDAGLAQLAERYHITTFGRAPSAKGFDLAPNQICFVE